MCPASASSAIESIEQRGGQFDDEEDGQDRRGDDHPAHARVTAVAVIVSGSHACNICVKSHMSQVARVTRIRCPVMATFPYYVECNFTLKPTVSRVQSCRRRFSQPRRSQGERSASTRARLIDATVDCLTQYGYAGTTTPRIAELAGLTRGAQVHHFGSKHDLMSAAMHHMTAKTVATVVAGFKDGYTRAEDPLGAILELIWDVHVAPGFVPVVELWVAGRTIPSWVARWPSSPRSRRARSPRRSSSRCRTTCTAPCSSSSTPRWTPCAASSSPPSSSGTGSSRGAGGRPRPPLLRRMAHPDLTAWLAAAV